MVGLFNIVSFVTPENWHGMNKFGGAFYAGYAFAMIAFVAHLILFFVFSSEKHGKRPWNMQTVYISFGALAVMVIAAMFCMFIPNVPNWLGIIICYAVLAFSVMTMISVHATGERAYNGNAKLNSKVSMMHELTDMSAGIMGKASNSEAAEVASKIYDAIKYSDPVSSNVTEAIEAQIKAGLESLSGMDFSGASTNQVTAKASEILNLIEERNRVCKSSKRAV